MEIWDQFPPGLAPLACPECAGKLVLRASRYGPFYGCVNFPRCKAAHGAHKQTGKPLGIPADKETKALRMQAHDLFDTLWQSKRMNRAQAYRWLRAFMDVSEEEAHIGRFAAEQCKKLIEGLLLRERSREKKKLDGANSGA